jgi:RES domain
MVLLDLPPPKFPPSPSFHLLDTGSQIVRIFNPNKYQTQALTFRFFGPIHRFDHHRGARSQIDPERGIYYAALTLSGCLVEYFGDTGVIEIADEQVAQVNITRPLTLLDLRGSGAMKAGSVAALAKTADRALSQQWSRYFYETEEIYSLIDGLIYFNAHNDEEAIALYERAHDGLACPETQVVRLSHPNLRPAIQGTALANNLIFKP